MDNNILLAPPSQAPVAAAIGITGSRRPDEPEGQTPDWPPPNAWTPWYATSDHRPAVIPPDVLTSPDVDAMGMGNNRRLSPVIGFPAMTMPAGFTSDGLPVGIEFTARPFSETMLLKLGYAYEEGTRNRKTSFFDAPAASGTVIPI